MKSCGILRLLWAFPLTMMNDLERLIRDYKDFGEKIAQPEIPILFGGRVIEDESTRRRFKSEFYVRSLTDVA